MTVVAPQPVEDAPGAGRIALPPDLLRRLSDLLPRGAVLSDPAQMAVFETDGFTLARSRPAAVVFCDSAEQVQSTVRLLAENDVPIVPRGSGTGLTGGCVAFDNGKHPGVVVSTARMNRILKIDLANRVAHVEAGVRNTELSDAASRLPGGRRYHFAPDPSSQRASTIGGNAATNAGGIHVLRDFVTSSHVLGLELVTADGELLTLGATDGRYVSPGGFDLPALVCGSEGTLGIITSVWVRLVPRRAGFRTIVGTFATQQDACDTVSEIIAAGHLPAAMEMLDGRMIEVVENAFGLGIPPGAQAMILAEIDGPEATLDEEMDEIVAIFQSRNALNLETAADPARKAQLWAARKKAFGAIGRISPSYCTQDACVPRSRLAEVLKKVDEIGRRHGLVINNVFHAGDGNVHPVFLYDDRDLKQVAAVLEAAEEVLMYCIDIGGTLTGEHGVGVEKLGLMPYMFDGSTMRSFEAVKASFDPQERINAGKLIPSNKVQGRLIVHPGRKVPQ
jgi:glycolate oxidase